MKYRKDNGKRDSSSRRSQNQQNDMENLLKNLPVLNEYFQLHKKIGQGTFSNVYLATLRNSTSTQKYAIKHLIQAFEQSKVQTELRCLQEIGGKDNVVPAELCLSNGTDCVTFIMPYLPHLSFADYVNDMDVEETRLYMKNLFIALRRVHSFNIIHRDVKPGNFLYNRETKQFYLVDFGLAQVVGTPKGDSNFKSILSDENLPIDYSKKRKRRESSCDESKSPIKPTKRMALKSMDNNIRVLPKVVGEAKPDNENKIFPSNFGQEVSFIQKSNKSSPNKTPLKERHLNNSILSPGSRDKLLDLSKAKNSSNKSPAFLKTETRAKGIGGNPMEPISTIASEKTPLSSPKTPNASYFNPYLGRSNRFIWKQTPSLSNLDLPGFQKQSPSTSSQLEPCLCSGKGAICSTCSSREKMEAPRAGTSGFRAPEVLFRYLHQNTAVDMWASGVIMLCILCRCYPFFNSSDDLTCLAEIMTVFGTERTMKVANKFGRRIVCSENRKAVDLKKLCIRLRSRSADKSRKPNYSNEIKCRDCLQAIRSDGCLCPSEETEEIQYSDSGSSPSPTSSSSSTDGIIQFPDSAYDLLKRLLDLDPTTRITAREALEHPFITGQ